jgi:hypothetical protein
MPRGEFGRCGFAAGTDTWEELRRAVFKYLEVDYNRNRRLSANGYLSPEAFEAKRRSGQNIA